MGDLAASANHALETLGLARLPDEAIAGFVGNGVRRLVARSLAASGGVEAVALLDRALAGFLAYYRAHLLDTTLLHGGIAETIDELRAREVVLSVATNKPEALARTILDGLGIGDAFVAVLGGDSVPVHKPDPEIVHALQRRSAIPPDHTLLVGDSLVDVETARAAGIAVCAVTWGLTGAEVLRGAAPDHVIERPEELLRLVG